MAKRVISLVLAIVMLIGMMPMIATEVEAASYDVINAKGVAGADIVKKAREYLGVPYDTSGGDYISRTGFGSKMMFDCSGFVYRVCREVGLASSRKNYAMGVNDPNGKPLEGQDSSGNYYITAHTQEQRYYGEDIDSAVKKYMDNGDYSGLCPGDLLFTTDGSKNSNGSTHVTHVVIYAGNGKIIHCEGYEGRVAEHSISRYSYNNASNWFFNGCRLVTEESAIIKEIHPAYCAIKIKSDTINVNSQPCEPTTDASSETLEVAKKDAQYQAIGLYLNKWGNLWYKVKLLQSEGTGYLYAGNTTYLAHSINDIEVPGVTAPTTLTKGKAWSLTGKVESTYNKLTEVSAYVYAGSNAQGEKETGDKASVTDNSYTLGGSTIDDKTEFNKLDVGTYTYVVSVTYENCHATSGKTYETKTDTIPVYQATFTVVESTSCSHSYTSKVTTAATCGAKGVKTYTCSKCGSSYTESIAATGNHTYTSKITKDETCTTSGIRTYTCSGCSKSYTETIEPYGHYYTPWETTSYADCTTEGTQTRTCFTCLNVETQAIPATGHNYQSTVIGATCVEYEKTIYSCTRCSDSYVEYGSAAFTDWSTTKPTGIDESLIESRTEYRYQTKEYTTSTSSTLDGWTQYAVSTQWSDYGSWSSWSDTAVTANDATKVETRTVYKYYYYQCPSCGAHMHGHGITCPTWAGGCGKGQITSDHYVKVWLTVSPDHADLKDFYGTGKDYAIIDGQQVFKHSDPESKTQYRYCTREQETVYSYYKWSDWTDWTTSAITQVNDINKETRTVYRYLDVKLGEHNYTSTVTAPTCTAQGYTTHTCTVCGDFYHDNYVEKLDHVYQSTVTNPTCTQKGYMYSVCSECGDGYYDNYTDALGHVYESMIIEPTCQMQGYTTHTCSVCGDSYKDTYTSRVPCKCDYAVIVTPTTETAGYIEGICEYCGVTAMANLPVLSLDHYKVEDLETATCTEAGLSRYTWKVTHLGIYSFDVVTEKTGHAYMAVTTAPTCTVQGYTTHICTICQDSYVDSFVSALGHNYQDGICSKCGGNDPTYNPESVIVASGICGDDLTWTLYGSGNLVISGTGEMYKYSSTAGEEAPWYAYAEQVKTVSFEGEVTKIGAYAFADCINLVDFAIPASVTTISNYAFRNCDSLTQIVIPDTVTGLGTYIFNLCDNLQSVEIGNGVTRLSPFTFGTCGTLSSIKIGSGVATLFVSAFTGCSNLTNVEVDANNVTYCSMDNAIYSEDGKILYFAAQAYEGLFDIPDSVETIGERAFMGCSLITEVTLPDLLTTIQSNAFTNCDNLTEITIPSCTPYIGTSAFSGCDGLKKIYFTGSKSSIQANAFAGVTATVYYPAEDSSWTEDVIQDYGGTITWTPYEVNSGVCGKNATWSLSDSGVLTISGSGDMYDYTSYAYVPWYGQAESITELVIENGITGVGELNFFKVSGLSEVTFPESISSIGPDAFNQCNNVAKITFEGDAPEISRDSFNQITAVAYYPANNDTWTEDVVQDYGGTITWVSYETATAMIGDAAYETVSEALAAAKNGDVVTLVKNTEEEILLIPVGVTLDLAGYSLKADYLIGFNGSYVTATPHSGRLIVPKGQLILGESSYVNAKGQNILPVWDPANNCYQFSLFVVNTGTASRGLFIDEENEEIYFQFKHQTTGAINQSLLADGASDNALDVIIRLEWTNANGTAAQDFYYNDTQIGRVTGENDYTFTLTGYSVLNIDLSTLKVTAMVVANSGATAFGTTWTHTEH